jgi:molybdopterin-binding protein
VLRALDLTFSYGRRTVLSLPSLVVSEGSITVIVGPNASGKTTLLKLLAGLERPDTGTVMGTESAVFVHDTPPPITGSVHYNVAYGLRARRVPGHEHRAKVGEALEAVGLAGQERRRASTLSSGERKRLGIARALALDPGVLLLDEPDAHVDAVSAGLVERVLRERKVRALTAVVSTHDPGFGYRLADQMIHLEDGRPVPGAVNILRGRVASREEGLCTFVSEGGVPIQCPAGDLNYVVAVVPLRDVVLATLPSTTSARNRLRGTVVSRVPEGPLERVMVDCGIRIEAYVTGPSVRDLDLRPGRQVWVSFKASAVSLY